MIWLAVVKCGMLTTVGHCFARLLIILFLLYSVGFRNRTVNLTLGTLEYQPGILPITFLSQAADSIVFEVPQYSGLGGWESQRLCQVVAFLPKAFYVCFPCLILISRPLIKLFQCYVCHLTASCSYFLNFNTEQVHCQVSCVVSVEVAKCQVSMWKVSSATTYPQSKKLCLPNTTSKRV